MILALGTTRYTAWPWSYLAISISHTIALAAVLCSPCSVRGLTESHYMTHLNWCSRPEKERRHRDRGHWKMFLNPAGFCLHSRSFHPPSASPPLDLGHPAIWVLVSFDLSQLLKTRGLTNSKFQIKILYGSRSGASLALCKCFLPNLTHQSQNGSFCAPYENLNAQLNWYHWLKNILWLAI